MTPVDALKSLFPGKDVHNIELHAAEINKARSFDEITEEEQTILLESLLDSQRIIAAVEKHEREIMLSKAIQILKLIPLSVK